ncbi:DUF7302 family protein [Leptospira stimsonii]|uniref:Uncharacterized protein n=1 Tax=Leptospira stimsonii TaxID=2202203 RepID=A0ABY2N9D3_9LEPT|nr:hypothetical protein [Leptospira stimsonii]TGK12796.1 hypothetical protein EHO98_19335 [Leptospira stimsonii]TGM18787.1 hypothetical protein EHQ90_06365 [Leptospira stimsonii]
MAEEKLVKLFRNTQNGKVTVRVSEKEAEELLKNPDYSRFEEPAKPQAPETQKPAKTTPQKEGE